MPDQRTLAPGRACDIPGCGRPHEALGLCAAHYRRTKRGMPLDTPLAATRHRGVRLTCGCGRPVHARGLCLPEYLAARRQGAFG